VVAVVESIILADTGAAGCDGIGSHPNSLIVSKHLLDERGTRLISCSIIAQPPAWIREFNLTSGVKSDGRKNMMFPE
jgi:hypothetical protein